MGQTIDEQVKIEYNVNINTYTDTDRPKMLKVHFEGIRLIFTIQRDVYKTPYSVNVKMISRWQIYSGVNGAQCDIKMDEKSQTYLISSRRDAYLIQSIDIVF